MNCGMSATIIAYRKSSDLDVLFENGEIAEGKSFASFQRGAIAYPSYINTEQRLGKSKFMNCGMSAKIIAYRKSNDIDVQFEDGTVVRHRNYSDFVKATISNPNLRRKK